MTNIFAKIAILATSISMTSCDGGSDTESSSSVSPTEQTRKERRLLPLNGLQDYTNDLNPRAFNKEITPDLEAGFNLSMYSPTNNRAYDQYKFPINLTKGKVYLSFDFMAEGLTGSQQGLTLHLDTPSVRNLNIRGGSENQFRVLAHVYTPDFLPYQDNTLYQVDYTIDLDNDHWLVKINGVQLYDGIFGASKIVNGRLSLGRIDNTFEPNLRVDIQSFKISTSPIR